MCVFGFALLIAECEINSLVPLWFYLYTDFKPWFVLIMFLICENLDASLDMLPYFRNEVILSYLDKLTVHREPCFIYYL